MLGLGASLILVVGRSKRMKDLARAYGYKGVIAGTRKTTPGKFLVLEILPAFTLVLLKVSDWSRNMA